jgi:hypothetical protein
MIGREEAIVEGVESADDSPSEGTGSEKKADLASRVPVPSAEIQGFQ